MSTVSPSLGPSPDGSVQGAPPRAPGAAGSGAGQALCARPLSPDRRGVPPLSLTAPQRAHHAAGPWGVSLVVTRFRVAERRPEGRPGCPAAPPPGRPAALPAAGSSARRRPSLPHRLADR